MPPPHTVHCYNSSQPRANAQNRPKTTFAMDNSCFGAGAVTTAVGRGLGGATVPASGGGVLDSGTSGVRGFFGPDVMITVAVTVTGLGTSTVTVTGAGQVAGPEPPLPGHPWGGDWGGLCPPGFSGVHGVLGGPCGQVPGPGGLGHFPGFPE